jgi:NADPH:quinone reductase-like Zn-dependent oxidoreductase
MGLRKPKSNRLGVDLAGVVVAVGGNVTRFKPGDEVFGGGTGAFVEYVAVPEDALVVKPANLSFEQAAAVPMAALTPCRVFATRARSGQGKRC